MKEKFDLSLDNRQIMSLLIAGIVVLGSVFVLGVVVGKKLSASDVASGAPDVLTALDQRAAALDEVRDASLTFQEELTRKTPDAPTVVTKAEAPPPPPKVEVISAPPPAPVVAAAPKEQPKPSAPPVEVTPGKVEEAPVVTRTAKDGGSKETVSAKRPLEATANGAFTLQLSASQNKGEADRFAARLRDKGYAPFIIEATVPGRGTWYRVRMGSFPTKEAATRYLHDFRRETQLDAFVAPSASR